MCSSGHRFPCFVTHTAGRRLADLKLRHRRRARAEDRLRRAKDIGSRDLPLHDYIRTRSWYEIVAPACDFTAWTRPLAPKGPAPQRESERLRPRLFFALSGK